MSLAVTWEELLPDKTPEERKLIFEAIWADEEDEDDDDV